MSKGRKHTIKTHPRLEEIKNKIISEAVVYREIAGEYGVSVSAIKHFAAEIKNEPTNRNIAKQIPDHSGPFFRVISRCFWNKVEHF